MSASPDLPSVVKITVVTYGERRSRLPAILALSAAVAVLILATAVTAPRLTAIGSRAAPAEYVASPFVRPASPIQRLAEVYRYPLGCLGITDDATPAARSVARADRAGPCWHYGVFVTAILARVRGTWGIALEAVSRACPALPLPAAVRALVAVCLRPGGVRQSLPPNEALEPASKGLGRLDAQRA